MSSETVIIPKIVLLKPCILSDLDWQPTKMILILPHVKSSGEFYNSLLWSHSKWLFSLSPQKKSALFALILLSLYCWWAIHIISTSGISMIPISAIYSFSKMLGSLYRLTLTQANFRESSLQAWSWLTFRMFSPEYFCLNHQCFVLKYFKNFWDWGRGGEGGGKLQPHSPSLYACASLLQVWGTRLQVTQNFMTALCLVFSW